MVTDFGSEVFVSGIGICLCMFGHGHGQGQGCYGLAKWLIELKWYLRVGWNLRFQYSSQSPPMNT